MYTAETHPFIAVDFDGTIIENGNFPEMGPVKPHAIETIKRMLKAGYIINIWTCRGGYFEELGKTQEEAIKEFLDSHGVDTSNIFVNEHFEYYLNKYPKNSPKIYASVYIDDKAVGVSNIDWEKISELFLDI